MGEITIKKASFDYKTVYMPYRNFAERTRLEYFNDLEGLVEALEKVGVYQVGELSLPVIERYIARLEQKGLASLTRKRKVVAIRSFLSFLYQEGYIIADIAKKVVLPFAEITTPFVLTQADCDRLRKTCSENPRDMAIIELFLQTGITLSELVRLTVDDIQFGQKDQGFIRILGSRGKKERMIPLNTKAYIAMKAYLSVRESNENDILFLGRFAQALGERGVQKMLRKYLKKARIGGASIRTLRHAFGAQHIAKGTNLKTIQEVMGLKDTRSTAVYQALAKEIVRRELQTNSI
jgi:site-specific recombinase XerD